MTTSCRLLGPNLYRWIAPPCLAHSLYHLVGERNDMLGYIETEHLGPLCIDDESELGRLPHRKIGGLLSAQNAVDVTRCLSQQTGEVDTVISQSPGSCGTPEAVHCGQAVSGGQLEDQIATNRR